MIIGSPQELYRIFDQIKPEDPKITEFMGVMYLFLYGCPCDSEKHWENAVSKYTDLKSVPDYIWRSISKESIQVKLDNELLFTI